MNNNQSRDYNYQYQQSERKDTEGTQKPLHQEKLSWRRGMNRCHSLSSLCNVSLREEEGKIIVAGVFHEVVLGILGHPKCKTQVPE